MNPRRCYVGVNLKTRRVEVVGRTPTLREVDDVVQVPGMHSDALDGVIWLTPSDRYAEAVDVAVEDTADGPIGLGWTFRKTLTSP